jgi:hypothetical protein
MIYRFPLVNITLKFLLIWIKNSCFKHNIQRFFFPLLHDFFILFDFKRSLNTGFNCCCTSIFFWGGTACVGCNVPEPSYSIFTLPSLPMSFFLFCMCRVVSKTAKWIPGLQCCEGSVCMMCKPLWRFCMYDVQAFRFPCL